ncbi:MAG: hypothetical protein U0359_25325 [Byssovorax sp.]
MPVEIARLDPDPLPAGTYRSKLAPAPAVLACAPLAPRAAADCLLATGDPSAFSALLSLGLSTEQLGETDGDGLGPFEDRASAAIAAGHLAAQAGAGELSPMLGDPNPSTQAFALRALRELLASRADAAGAQALAREVAARCVPFASTGGPRVASTAALCVETSKDPEALGALVRPFVTRSELTVRLPIGKAILSARKGSLDERALRAIAEAVSTPLAVGTPRDPLRGYDIGCQILSAQVPDADWAREAGKRAKALLDEAGMGGWECAHLGAERGSTSRLPETF